MKNKHNSFLNKIGALITAVLMLAMTTPVYAASLSSISGTMTRQKISTLSSHTIVFTLSGSNTFATGETITIDFGEDSSGFAVAGASSVVADFDFNDGTERTIAAVNVGAPSCSAGVNNVAVGIDDTTGIVTIQACTTYTASGAGAVVTIEYGTAATGGTDRVTNPAAKGTYVIPIAGTFGDTGRYAVSIPEASGDDQIPVSATVNPSITFTVVNTALALGDLSASSISTSGLNDLTIGTNATGGYTIKIQDVGGSGAANPGLYDSVSTALIASASATLSVGNEGYGGQCEVHAGSGTCGFSLTSAGEAVTGFHDNSWDTFASHSSKPSGNEVFHIRVKASISTSTTAGNYADTLTLVATGNF
jgi:hypothetical protein